MVGDVGPSRAVKEPRFPSGISAVGSMTEEGRASNASPPGSWSGSIAGTEDTRITSLGLDLGLEPGDSFGVPIFLIWGLNRGLEPFCVGEIFRGAALGEFRGLVELSRAA